jgi:hypothetical protein
VEEVEELEKKVVLLIQLLAAKAAAAELVTLLDLDFITQVVVAVAHTVQALLVQYQVVLVVVAEAVALELEDYQELQTLVVAVVAVDILTTPPAVVPRSGYCKIFITNIRHHSI